MILRAILLLFLASSLSSCALAVGLFAAEAIGTIVAENTKPKPTHQCEEIPVQE